MTVTHEVAGSIPVRVAFASVAQLVERMHTPHGGGNKRGKLGISALQI